MLNYILPFSCGLMLGYPTLAAVMKSIEFIEVLIDMPHDISVLRSCMVSLEREQERQQKEIDYLTSEWLTLLASKKVNKK